MDVGGRATQEQLPRMPGISKGLKGGEKKSYRQDRGFKPPPLCAGNESISVGLRTGRP